MTIQDEPSLHQLQQGCVSAALVGMQTVRLFQTGVSLLGRARTKWDTSVVTAADEASEADILADLEVTLPGIPVLGEESGLYGFDGTVTEYTGRYIVLVDPVDGTSPLALGGSTSTVAVSIYDLWQCQVVAAAIGCPATGKLFYSHRGANETFLAVYDTATWEALWERERCQVWGGLFNRRASVFLDISHGFEREDVLTGQKRQTLSDGQVVSLMAGLSGAARLQMYGSNAFHQALVAGGGEYAAGSVTSAVGGPWDLAGALLVLEAGGVAQGFQLEWGGVALVTVDPLDALRCDMLITAHNSQTLEQLTNILTNAVA